MNLVRRKLRPGCWYLSIGAIVRYGDSYVASGFHDEKSNTDRVTVFARTIPSARRRFEREVDRRSIGLLGVDDVKFETAR